MASVAVLLPMLTWSAYRLDESRADGAVFSMLALAFTAFTLWKQKRIAVLPGSFLILGALLCGFIPLLRLASGSTGWAPSLGGLADRAPLLAAWVFAAAAATWQDLSARRLALPLLFGGGIAALLGIVQAFGWDPPGYDSLLSIRPAYPFAGPSHAIEVQLPLLLLGLVFLPKDLRERRIFWLLLAPIALQVGYLGSNAGRLGLIAACAWMILRQRAHRLPIISALVLVVCGELMRSFLGGASILPPDSAPRGVSVRKEIYLASSGHILTTPLGIGIGRFESDYPEWRPEEEARLTSGNWADTSNRIPKTPHQEFLLTGLELGWVGSLLLAVALLRLARGRRETGGTEAVWIGLGVLAMLRSPFSDNPAALGIAALLLGSDLRTLAPQIHFRGMSLLPLGLGILAVTPAWAQLRGEQHVAAAVQDQEFLEKHLTAAVEARPWDNRSLVLLGSFYFANQEFDAARNCFDRALVYNPTDLAALTAYIKVEMFAPDGDEVLMLRLLARGEEFAPFHPSVKQARILWLQSYKKAFLDEAVRRIQKGIPNAGPWWLANHLAEAYIAAVNGNAEETKQALFRASAYAKGGNKGLLERTAEQPALEPDTIAELTRRVFPQWPRVAY
ncbi:MAG: tetratricopeptide repeat protein [Planctomycetota bacterium]